ncbi:MAG: biopolymer transporter ExbD [Bacteroidia bacterium]|nr:biopolymer transporter ExbD [Bacteroidia bacterium]
MLREVPEIPSASIADIAFILLLFFIIATTMDTDSGIARRLPPLQPEQEMVKQPQIKERNVFVVLLNKDDQLLVENKPLNINQLRETTKEFIENPYNNEKLPEKEVIDVPFLGKYMVSKGVLSLQNDRGTTFGAYLEVQNELVAAYNELRDELAIRKFGKRFDNLDYEKQEAIKKIYPQKISEAEPKNIGGK